MNYFAEIGVRLLSYFKDCLYILPVVLISLTFHECAHGYIAYKLGDPTAKNEGRLTLNPLKHIDPFGFIMMFLVRFGWAKPVPVNPMYFKNPKKGMMYTAVAGPLSNLALAAVSSLIYTVLYYAYIVFRLGFLSYICTFFLFMIMINIGLAVFNLIPVYPLDGSRIFAFFMPEKFNDFIRRYGSYIYIVFFVLVIMTNVVGKAISTVQISLTSLLLRFWSIPVSFIFKLFY